MSKKLFLILSLITCQVTTGSLISMEGEKSKKNQEKQEVELEPTCSECGERRSMEFVCRDCWIKGGEDYNVDDSISSDDEVSGEESESGGEDNEDEVGGEESDSGSESSDDSDDEDDDDEYCGDIFTTGAEEKAYYDTYININ